MRIAHIINPVNAGLGSDLRIAQPVTFESMRVAVAYSAPSIQVDLISAQFTEDRGAAPSFISMTPDLDRSAADVGTFSVPRKLPLLSDILERVYEASPRAEVIVYTNVDIALVPHFYASVHELMQHKDAIVINRRTIPAIYDSVDQLDLMYALAGKPHPGFDCFVFRSELMESLDLGHSLIGAPWVGTTMLRNLAQCSSSFALHKDLHLTFHIGDDRTWQKPEYEDYRVHNRHEFLRMAELWLASCPGLHPLVAEFHTLGSTEQAGRRATTFTRLARRLRQRSTSRSKGRS